MKINIKPFQIRIGLLNGNLLKHSSFQIQKSMLKMQMLMEKSLPEWNDHKINAPMWH